MDTKTATVLVVVIISIAFAGLQQGCVEEQKETYSQTREVMGTIVTVAAVSGDGDTAYRATGKAFDRMVEIENLMSSYDGQSQLSVLNREKHLDNTDPAFTYVLEQSKYYSELTGGAFDITIQPILDLWADQYGEGKNNQPPSQEAIDEVLARVNSPEININGTSVTIGEEMAVALGGIAKGYAVDEAVTVLREEGIDSGFVNAGGDGYYFGEKPDGSAWTVGLQDPEKSADPVTIITVRDRAVTTSGNYERYYNESAAVSHIADPRTGYPSSELISSTIIADSALEADALATAVFVMGEEDGLTLVESLDRVECLIITPDKRIVRSEGFAAYEQ